MSKASRRRQPPGSTPTGHRDHPGPRHDRRRHRSSSCASSTARPRRPTPTGPGTTSGPVAIHGSSQGPGGSAGPDRRPTATDTPTPAAALRRTVSQQIVVIAAMAGVALIGRSSSSRRHRARLRLLEPVRTRPRPPARCPGSRRTRLPAGRHGQQARLPGSKVTYTYCPPASGNHYIAPPRDPSCPALLRAERQDHPAGLGPQPGARRAWSCSIAETARGRRPGASSAPDFFALFPPSPICNIATGHDRQGPVFTRFDEHEDAVRGPCLGPRAAARHAGPARDPRVLPALGRAAQPGAAVLPAATPTPTPVPSGSPSASPSGSPSASPSGSPSPASPAARVRARARARARRRAPARADPRSRHRGPATTDDGTAGAVGRPCSPWSRPSRDRVSSCARSRSRPSGSTTS